jgi:hypothetical protein
LPVGRLTCNQVRRATYYRLAPMTTVLDRPVQTVGGSSRGAGPPRWAPVAAGAVLVAGVVLRFSVRSDLWLDEALSVNIARLPLADIPNALRHDGAPPLYYLLLHVWMQVFGTGDVAVRALSGVFAVAVLPVLYFAGRRLGGRRVGLAAVLVAAASPFANHYATEARMYSLVVLIVSLGFLAVARAIDDPSPWRLAAVALCSAALLYTHYWGIYLLTTVGAWLLWKGWRASRREDRSPYVRVVAALAAGGVLFLPWLPVFRYQAAHTGTPWAKPADFGALSTVIEEFAGGTGNWPQLLAFVLFALALLGLFGRAVDHRRVELDLHTLPRARGLGIVLIGTPLLAIVAGMATHTAFVARYTSVVFPAFCLLVALGIAAFADRRTAAVVLTGVTLLGLWCSLAGAIWAPRTQAGELAAAIKAQARPGDVVVFCPDQLGPAVSRELAGGPALDAITYPRGTPPERVDWVDYRQAIEAAPVDAFAADVVRRAGTGHDIWLVMGRGYRPYNGRCTTLVNDLTALRPAASLAVRTRPIRYFEHGALYKFAG